LIKQAPSWIQTQLRGRQKGVPGSRSEIESLHPNPAHFTLANITVTHGNHLHCWLQNDFCPLKIIIMHATSLIFCRVLLYHLIVNNSMYCITESILFNHIIFIHRNQSRIHYMARMNFITMVMRNQINISLNIKKKCNAGPFLAFRGHNG